MLETQEATFAAKPYMDVAVDLFDAYKNDHIVMDVEEKPDLAILIRFAEKKARDAASGARIEEPKGIEARILEAYQAKADLQRAETAVDIDTSTSQSNIQKAIEVASDRSRTASDVREKGKWFEMTRKLQRYADFNNMTTENDQDARNEFGGDTRDAAILLSHSFAPEAEGRLTETETIRLGDIRSDIVSMNKQKEMNDFLAELYPRNKQPEQQTEYTNLTDDQVAAAKRQLDSMNVRS